jgi:hypothetical protein
VNNELDRRSFLKEASTPVLAGLIKSGDAGAQSQTPPAGTANAEFPRRALMKPIVENSLEYRLLSKPVQESMILDDMESDRGWRAEGIAKFEYTNERARAGTRSLRMRCSERDEQHIRRNRDANGNFYGTSGGNAGIFLKFDPPQDWNRYNRISLWVYVHPCSITTFNLLLRFLVDGIPGAASMDPRPFNYVYDLKQGEWNHVVWEIPEFERARVTEFAILKMLTGPDVIVTYDIDQIALERVDVEKYEGWEVASGKIAFSHIGYRPADEKLAFVSGNEAAEFELLDAAGGRSAGRFPVRRVENRRGRFGILDFTSFTRPGTYTLRCGDATSRPFPISDEFWYPVLEKAVHYYYGERCGFDIPDLHGACHQDMQATLNGVTKVVNGGWHDAGDLFQIATRTSEVVYALFRNYEQLKVRDLETALRARVLEEAKWGSDWLLKSRFAPGFRVTNWAIRIFTDNKPGTVDEVTVPVRNTPLLNYLAVAASASAARLLEDVDAKRAAAHRLAAEEDFQATPRGPSEPTPSDRGMPVPRDLASAATLAALELYRLTGKQDYAADAARFAKELTACQEQRLRGSAITGYFCSNSTLESPLHPVHTNTEGLAISALRQMCETFPAHADWVEWYGAAVLHSEYFMLRGASISEPYRHLPNRIWRDAEIDAMLETAVRGLHARVQGSEGNPNYPSRLDDDRQRRQTREQIEAGVRVGPDARLRVYPVWTDTLFHGNTGVQLSAAASLAEGARLRNNLDAASLVRMQLQWVFGGNPFSQSLMFGEGYDFMKQWGPCLSHNVVGSVPVGMDDTVGDAPRWPAANHMTYKEVCVFVNGYLLSTLAHMAMPARVTGRAPAGVVFRETRTGRSTRARSGFALNLAAGDYAIEYGGITKRILLLPGGNYDLTLDPQRAVDIELSAGQVSNGAVRIEARVRGSDAHNIELRAFNGSISGASVFPVDLKSRGERTLAWDVRVINDDKPWVAVAIPDANHDSRKEVFGAAHELPRIT